MHTSVNYTTAAKTVTFRAMKTKLLNKFNTDL